MVGGGQRLCQIGGEGCEAASRVGGGDWHAKRTGGYS